MCYLPGSELIETLEGSFHSAGREETIVITRSNKRAVVYNQGIRARILGRESELPARGDLVMAVKNNYFWAEQEQPAAERMTVCHLTLLPTAT